jgi:ribose transport system ATP-binding protein
LILDHPWRGLDVGAKAEAVASIRDLARGGLGIVLVTDAIDELIALSDNLVVMKSGVVSGTFTGSSAKPPDLRVLECML